MNRNRILLIKLEHKVRKMVTETIKKMISLKILNFLQTIKLDIELMATIYTNIINSTFQPEFFIENSLLPKLVLPAFVEMVSGGFLSEEGQKYYQQIRGNRS